MPVTSSSMRWKEKWLTYRDSFFPQSKKKNFFRLNFSYNDDDVIEEGVKRLADALKAYLADRK